MDLTKDVTVGAHRYQIAKFKARDASWILAQILTKMLPAVIESALAKETGAQLPAGRTQLTEDEFSSIQGHALAVCRRYNAHGVPMPVFVLPNSFSEKDLEYDVIGVLSLTIHALVFTLASFFEDDGLNQILSLLPALGLGSSVSKT